MLPNWIADQNRFNLVKPPEWFLKRLWDFDAQLVIIPSRREPPKANADGEGAEPPAYLLTRRRQYSANFGDVAMLNNKNPDTNMCFAHHLVPVAPLRFQNGCSTFTMKACDDLLKELRARDSWGISGGPDKDGDKVADAVEYAEAQAEQKRRSNLRDMFHHMARDAYHSLQARMGWRNKTSFDGNRHAKKGGRQRGERKPIVSFAQRSRGSNLFGG